MLEDSLRAEVCVVVDGNAETFAPLVDGGSELGQVFDLLPLEGRKVMKVTRILFALVRIVKVEGGIL